MSAHGYFSPSPPCLPDGESGASFGHFGPNVGNRPDFHCYTPSFGRRERRRHTVKSDPEPTFGTVQTGPADKRISLVFHELQDPFGYIGCVIRSIPTAESD